MVELRQSASRVYAHNYYPKQPIHKISWVCGREKESGELRKV